MTKMYDGLVEALRLCVKYGKAEDALANAQKAADAIEELRKPKWIPVTERLPKDDEGKYVLVYDEVYGRARTIWGACIADYNAQTVAPITQGWRTMGAEGGYDPITRSAVFVSDLEPTKSSGFHVVALCCPPESDISDWCQAADRIVSATLERRESVAGRGKDAAKGFRGGSCPVRTDETAPTLTKKG